MKPLTPNNPHAIIMLGIPGSGKSAFADRFAETFQAPIINQSLLMRTTSLSESAIVPVVDSFLTEILKTNRTFLFEGATTTKATRDALAKKLRAANYTPLFVWVQTESLESKRRALKPFPQGSGLTESQFDAAVASFQAPVAAEQPVVVSGKHTYASQLKIVLKHLSLARPEARVAPARRRPQTSRDSMLR